MGLHVDAHTHTEECLLNKIRIRWVFSEDHQLEILNPAKKYKNSVPRWVGRSLFFDDATDFPTIPVINSVGKNAISARSQKNKISLEKMVNKQKDELKHSEAFGNTSSFG